MHIGITGPIDITSINLNYDGDRSSWPRGMGGVPVNHLINALVDKGHKLSIFSSSPEIPIGQSFEWHEEKLSIYMGPHRKRARDRCLDFFAKESNYIKEQILKAKPDFVHAHWQYEWANGALKSGLTTLITCHDSPVDVFKAQTDWYRFYRLLMAILIIRKAKYLTTVSDYCAKGLKYLTSKEINVIPNFEPDTVFNHYKSKRIIDSKIQIGMINNGFTLLKNVKVGILAFEQFCLKNSYAELHLFGKSFGENQEAYEWCKENRVNMQNIHFRGEFQFDLLMEKLNEMNLFLHTSIEESFGMVLVEAMAMGIPVIAGKKSGGPESILRDGGGLLVDIKSIDEVESALIKLTNTDLYMKYSEEARTVALNRFSKTKVVQQYLDAYELLVK